MSEINPRPGKDVGPKVFEQFVEDLKLVIGPIKPETVAKWLNMDAANFSNKMRGVGKNTVTTAFLVNFYGKLSSVIEKIHRKVPAHQIIMEMERVEEPETYKNLHEEMRLLKETVENQGRMLSKHEAAIQALKGAKGGEGG
ncbi:MAG TPA: hypothetical protein VNW04_18350 [Puia sp.]|jgi:hypothetical protein|nr:hypothetical protein [Puia sp.]